MTRKNAKTNPIVLVVDPSEERRMLTMQLVAIEWPDAQVEEFASVKLLGPMQLADLPKYDAVVFGLEDPEMVRELRAFMAMPFCPGVVAVGRLDPLLHQAMTLGAVVCVNEQDLTKANVGHTIREAMDATERARRQFEKTMPIAAAGKRTEKRPLRTAPRDSDVAKIPGYRIIEQIGEGGMSRVYLADDTRHGRRLVLKVFDPRLSQDERELVLFLKETAIISELDTPFVVRIYDHGVTDHHAFIAMEHLPGGDLKERIRAGIDPARALSVLLQMFQALDAVHRAGIVHRDLKPQNVMFRSGERLVLVDFGISKLHGSTTIIQGNSLGTPAYFSPEQVMARSIDLRSDLYSAGAIFYEMLTGRRPFYATEMTELLRMHVEDPPPPLPAPVAEFQDIIDRLMAKDPDQRFQSAAEAMVQLKRRWPNAA